jgi:hypothetical protein
MLPAEASAATIIVKLARAIRRRLLKFIVRMETPSSRAPKSGNRKQCITSATSRFNMQE